MELKQAKDPQLKGDSKSEQLGQRLTNLCLTLAGQRE
jgi:hypothetical protein